MQDKIKKFRFGHLFNHFSGDFCNYIRKFLIKKFIVLLDENSDIQQKLGMPDYNNPENPKWTKESAEKEWEEHLLNAKDLYKSLTGKTILAETEGISSESNFKDFIVFEDLVKQNLFDPNIKIKPNDISLKANFLILNFDDIKTQLLFQKYLFFHEQDITKFIQEKFDDLDVNANYDKQFYEYHILKNAILNTK